MTIISPDERAGYEDRYVGKAGRMHGCAWSQGAITLCSACTRTCDMKGKAVSISKYSEYEFLSSHGDIEHTEVMRRDQFELDYSEKRENQIRRMREV